MATKYTATHRGFTFTRTTKSRTYTHTVVAPISLRGDRANCERWTRERWASDLQYHQHAAQGLPTPGYSYPVTAKMQADSAALLAAGEDAFVADALAHFDANASRRQLDTDGDTSWVNVGWNGRLDLAQKLAAGYPGAVILEAVAG